MNQTKKDALKAQEKKRRSYLIKHEAGNIIAIFAFNGLWLFEGGLLLAIFRFVIRCLPFLIGFGVSGNLLIGLVSYVGTWLAVLGIGKWMSRHYEAKLNEMQDACQADHLAFFNALCQELDIQCQGDLCLVSFDDGTVVDSHGKVFRPIIPAFQRPSVSFRLYQMEDFKENTAYTELVKDMPWNKTSMKDMFASIDFNRKFGIITGADAQRDCLRYFTPSVMVEMIKNNRLQTFKEIDVKEDLFNATTDHRFETPEILDLFAWTSIVTRYEETEAFCRNFRTAAETVHTDMESIHFMLTA